MKQSQFLAEFSKSNIVEPSQIETSTDFLNFVDVNFKLKFRTILSQKKASPHPDHKYWLRWSGSSIEWVEVWYLEEQYFNHK